MTRMTTPLNGNAGGHKANGSAGLSFGAAPSGGGSTARRQPLQHIDDVTSVTIDSDFDPSTPIDRLLVMAGDLLREAETFRNFGGRIDMAMKSYLKASILLLHVMKKNKGLEAGDNKAQKKRYDELLRQVKASHGVFEQIKLEIKADNAKSGVQPTVHRSMNGERSSLALPKENRPSFDEGGSSDGILTPSSSPRALPIPASASTHSKARPPVHPKPEALHGNAIAPLATTKATEDLDKRFASLRPHMSAPQQLVQDPRIRTQPIIVPPAMQRGHVNIATARPRVSIDSDMYDLPQMPGAIYKPARGTVSTEAAELPSSSSRRFSLARSLTSGPLNSPSPSAKSPLASLGEESNEGAKRTKLTIPDGETLSVTELLRLMKEGSKTVSILLIDIRSREAFDEGHIMSQATICIEPEVLMRKFIAANEIADSMVLAPSSEQINFERRHGFDLVVLYDQNSTRIGTKASNPHGDAVQGLYNALVHFDVAGEDSPRPPKLLEGGLDAWTSVMGSSSLATTATSVARPLGSAAKARKAVYTPRRRQSHVPKPIQDPEEARRWEGELKDPESFRPIYNTDDFLRRYPSVTSMQESMTSPGPPPGNSESAPGNSVPPPGNSVSAPGPMPAELRRPAAIFAKTSFSGFSGKDEHDSSVKGMPRPQNENSEPRRRVGLRNPGNWCYANASLQALFATPGFAAELARGGWEREYVVPMKSDEKMPNPQLLGKTLSQVFGWMDRAVIHPMEARTLMQYAKHIHGMKDNGKRRPASETFGGAAQHDAQEFFSYLLEVLDDETNRRRDQKVQDYEVPDNDRHSLLHNSIKYWLTYTTHNESIVTKYWRYLQTHVRICKSCGSRSVRPEAGDFVDCPIQSKNLKGSLEQYVSTQKLMMKCGSAECKENGQGWHDQSTYLSRLPDRLTIRIKREKASGGEFKKDQSRFTFPFQNLDMEPYFIPRAERFIDPTDASVAATAERERHFRPPFKYDCYAVVCHKGRDKLDSGHYIAYVRNTDSNDPTDWIEFNDAQVTPVKIGSSHPGDMAELLFGIGDESKMQAYFLLYRRRDT